MKINKIALSAALAALLVAPAVSFADEAEVEVEEPYQESTAEVLGIEISGDLYADFGVYTGSGQTHNPLRNADNTPQTHDAGDASRNLMKANLYINGEIGEESSWHAQLQAITDTQAEGDDFRYFRNNSEFEAVRELYFDTTLGDLDLRIGKQQVVWGTADGVKFLDIINPTDFRYWGQETMEDSRIPLWMLTAEYPIGDDGSLQLVYVPQVNVGNQISGLIDVETGDQGQQFVSLGASTITGKYNGFKNIGPDMGKVAGAFTQGFNGLMPNWANPNILAGFKGMTVGMFTGMDGQDGRPDVDQFLQSTIPGGSGYTPGSVPSGVTGNMMLSGIANNQPDNPQMPGVGATTNLMGLELNAANPSSMFDYMANTTFATFDTFVGINTAYVRDREKNDWDNGNIGLRYKGSTDGGFNYSLNYYYHYDNNPVIDVSWQGTGGRALTANATTQGFDQNGRPVGSPGAGGEAYKTSTMSLEKADGSHYDYATDGPATMVFTESQNKINTFGTSFDYAIDTPAMPIILRGEFVYDKGVKAPVVDLDKLSYGDIAGAMKNLEADFVKYIIGVDVTVMTNLFLSFQFMDNWNLDYIDETVDQNGDGVAHSRHSANPATMNMSNGMKAAEEHQIMYTFFFSKPFLESDAMRVNNIFLLENENLGWWNRLDLEYSWSDDILFSAAWNQYGGDKNGVFGQFEDMSNVQVGVKYIF